MIQITVRYHTPLRQARGLRDEQVALPAGTSLCAAVKHLANSNSPTLRGMLLGPDGGVSPHLVIFRNGSLAAAGRCQVVLADGDELMLFLAVSGG